ncbi:MAG: hypothetical protein ACRD0H_17855, partial [Actinomycetes bacterium]
PQHWTPFDLAVPARTAALVWCAAAVVCAVVLGVAGGGAVVVPAFLPPIVTGLLLAWRGAGRAPGALWAVGLMPLVILVGGPGTAVAFVALVEGFAYLVHLSGTADDSSPPELRVQRRPLEIELVLYSLASWTTGIDMTGLLIVACLAGLLWRRRWTAAVAAAITGLALVVELNTSSVAGVLVSHGLVYVVLTAHWLRAISHGPWLASRLSMTELGLVLSGRALRGGRRVVQRTVENALPPLVSPPRGGLFQGTGNRGNNSSINSGDNLLYCWTCHRKTEHKPAGFSPPICLRCVRKAGNSRSERTLIRSCPVCRQGPTPHTAGGKCLNCWKDGR